MRSGQALRQAPIRRPLRSRRTAPMRLVTTDTSREPDTSRDGSTTRRDRLHPGLRLSTQGSAQHNCAA